MEELTLTKADRDAATRVAIQAAREDLLSFILMIDPTFSVGPHHRFLCDVLMDVESGKSKRAMVSVAPRSSKSLITSVYFPAWALGRNPSWQLIEVSHSSDLATEFGRAVRDILHSPDYKLIFPETEIRKDNRAADNWGTTKRGKFIAAGAGTGIAGKGAHLGIIDDPISEQDAWSKSSKERINNWYPGGFRSRLMPGGRVVIVQTRWAEDDLTGDLLMKAGKSKKADQWDCVRIPALNTHESLPQLNSCRIRLIEQEILPNDYPELELNESFWPAPSLEQKYFWSTDELMATKYNMPDFQWDALYMQNPTPIEGGIIKTKFWQAWEAPKPPPCSYKILSLDTAFSEKTTADYSAYTLWGVFSNSEFHETAHTMTSMPSMILLGAGRGHWSFPQLRSKVLEKYDKHRPDVVLVEKKASGQSLIQELRMAGVPVIEYQPERDKVARAYTCSTIFHNKRIFSPLDRTWAKDVINECRVFPSGANDDYVDTVTQAVLWLTSSGQLIHTDSPWNRQEDDDIIKRETDTRSYY